MNDRQRFLATMRYQPRDRSPLYDFSFWDETLPIWHEQGLPRWVERKNNAGDFFGMDLSLGAGGQESAGVNSGLCPAFELKVLEDRGDHEVVQQNDGVRVLRKKFMGSIPMHEGHLLEDRASWETHYKPRLDPDHPARRKANWEDRVRRWKDPNREHILTVHGGSLYGYLRNWMGMENVSLVVYDDPAFFQEMVETMADCIVGTLEMIFATGGKFDACAMWEDMCFNSGPLLSPDHFKQFLVPHYRRITDLCRRNGVEVIWVDCDGDISKLVPLWLDAGVNCMFPMEIGTWGADPIQYRKEYGRELLMMGGFDKHLLAQSKEAIEAEVCRLAPLVEEGGFIGFCDHRVPPDVPYENYLHYLRVARKVWGRGVNLKPMHEATNQVGSGAT